MSQTPLPAGYHDADSAAQVFGITKRILLKSMRDMGWLYSDSARRNLPREELKLCKWLTTQERTHGLRGAYRNIGRVYHVMLITPAGMEPLACGLNGESVIIPGIKKTPHHNTNEAPHIATTHNSQTAHDARDALMKQMREL